uniref:Uncharacterized protein n=1 Tax=Bionectria ochroleuca TaxID=29856 RepID=A0A0B7JYU8_BIOOC
MGKFQDEPIPSPNPATPVGESPSSINLHSHGGPSLNSTERYFDDDPTELHADDLPPLYSDLEQGPSEPINPLIPPGTNALKVRPFLQDKNKGIEYYLDHRLDTNPEFLAEHLAHLAVIPPRPHVHIRGVHSEQVRKSDGKSERREIVDFNLQIELTHLLSRAGLKNFSFERQIEGWDFELLRGKLETLLRSTNYRGRLAVEFPVLNARVEIYNDCLTNRWRLTKWIEMIFVFTLMFVFTWPWLLLRTARWETVNARWHLSAVDAVGRKRYSTLSEEQWYNMWARPIQKAALERRQGTLDQGDLNRAGLAPDPQGGFASAVQAGVDAMGVVNRSFGWGGDS